MSDEQPSRRSFLIASGAIVAGSAALGGFLAEVHKKSTSAAKAVMRKLPTSYSSAAPLPSDPAVTIDGLSPLITPTKDFFRIDTAFDIPNIDVNSWKLVVDGMVDQLLTFTYDEILAMPMIEVDCTIGCVSNEVGGDLVGNARWLGVKLSEVLAKAKPQTNADQVLSVSSDGFSAGFPFQNAFDRDAIIAVAMNGQPLTAEHGYPVRLVVPGLYGYVSATKWLTEITITRFDQKKGFWITRGWSELGPVKTESRIDNFKQGQAVAAQPTKIAGVAWAPTRGITKVEVRIDDGPWQSATLGPQINADTWRQWWIDWTPTSGKRRITVRATDGSGYTQTSKAATVEPDGATGWHSLVVNVT